MYIDCFAYKNTNQLSSYQLFPLKNYEKHRGGASRQGARSPRECPPTMSYSPLANANIVTFMGKGCPKGGKGVLVPHRLFHPIKELLLKLLSKLIVRVDLQSLLIVLHHIHIVTLTILSRILNNAHHIEESTKSTYI